MGELEDKSVSQELKTSALQKPAHGHFSTIMASNRRFPP